MIQPYVIGYARTSTRQQDLTLQRIALEKAGCMKTYDEQESGAKRNRPVLKQVLEMLRPGDTFVIWKLDRLARSLKHLMEIAEDLAARGVNFKSLTEGFDTTTAGGTMIFHVIGAMAQFERSLIAERREAGLAKAKANGVKFGRKRLDSGGLAKALLAIERDEMSIAEAARVYGVTRSVIYRRLGEFRTVDSLQSVSNVVTLHNPAIKAGA